MVSWQFEKGKEEKVETKVQNGTKFDEVLPRV